MKVRVIQPITTIKGTTPAGTIIEIPASLLIKLKGKVEAIGDSKKLSHYCLNSDSWCYEKLPDRDFPTGCVRFNCEYYKILLDNLQLSIDPQDI